MARITDHPVRLARVQKGLSQVKLAQLAQVNRSALTALEDGRTLRPSAKLLGVLAVALQIEPQVLSEEIEAWLSKPLSPLLRPSAKNLLLIPPYVLSQYYQSFVQWRLEFAPTVTAFASMLRINPAIVRDFESGKLASLPDGLAGRLLQLGVSAEYLVALEGLSRG